MNFVEANQRHIKLLFGLQKVSWHMEELEVVLEVYKWILWGGFDNNDLWESFLSIFGNFKMVTFRRRVKSPEVVETTFTMSTIEEEMEGVSSQTVNKTFT